MRFQKFINEGINTNILCIDIQPEYDNWCKVILPDVVSFLNSHKGNITFLYNGDEVTSDTKNDVIDYFIENGLNENIILSSQFIEKTYGFLRTWMDYEYISNSTIIKVLREMAIKRVNDSKELNLKEFLSEDEYDELMEDEGISFPDNISLGFLKKISPFYMIGGGRNECLREIELICNAFNIRYKRMDSLIY